MPKVQVYESNVSPIATPQLRQADAGASAFGSVQAEEDMQSAKALSDVAKAGYDIYSEVNRQRLAAAKAAAIDQAHYEKLTARDALNQARNEARQYTSEVYTKTGKDQIDVYTDAELTLQEIRDKYAKGLSPGARDYFTASYDSMQDEHLNKIATFQAEGRMKFENETLDFENQNATDDAVLMRKDPKAIAESEHTVMTNTQYKYRNMPPAEVKKQVFNSIHALNASVLDAITNESPIEALSYLEANKAKFNPSYVAERKKKLEELANEEKARAASVAIANLPIPEQQAALDAIKDTKLYDKTRTYVKERVAAKADADEASYKAITNAEVDKIFKDPANYEVPYKQIEDAKTQEHLYNLKRSMLAHLRDDKENKVKTDPKVYYDLMKMDSAEFKKVDLLKYVNSLAPSDFQEMVRLQQKDANEWRNAQTFTNYIAQFSKGQAKDFESQAFLKSLFEDRLNQYPKEERNKIATWNKVADELTMSMDVKGSFFDAPLWKAKLKGKEVIEPATRPPEVPAKAKWVDTTIDGKTIRGWQETNPNGVTILYGVDGGTYRIKK